MHARTYALVLLLGLFGLGGCSWFRTDQPAGPPAPRVQLESGLEWVEIAVGTGAAAVPGSLITVGIEVWLEDGELVSSTLSTGLPETFALSAAPLAGLRAGLQDMRVGGKRLLFVPAHLAQGDAAEAWKVPPETSIVLLLDLVAVEPLPPPEAE